MLILAAEALWLVAGAVGVTLMVHNWVSTFGHLELTAGKLMLWVLGVLSGVICFGAGIVVFFGAPTNHLSSH